MLTTLSGLPCAAAELRVAASLFMNQIYKGLGPTPLSIAENAFSQPAHNKSQYHLMTPPLSGDGHAAG
jgi:hypothetical protein